VVVGYAMSSLSDLTPFRWTLAGGMEAIAAIVGHLAFPRRTVDP